MGIIYYFGLIAVTVILEVFGVKLLIYTSERKTETAGIFAERVPLCLGVGLILVGTLVFITGALLPSHTPEGKAILAVESSYDELKQTISVEKAPDGSISQELHDKIEKHNNEARAIKSGFWTTLYDYSTDKYTFDLSEYKAKSTTELQRIIIDDKVYTLAPVE